MSTSRHSRSGPSRPTYKKKWGQHHLVDPALCDPLVRFLAPEGALVVEIGPGAGALTGRLLDAGGRVLACEVDLDWLFRVARGPLGPRGRWVGLDARGFPWDRLPPGSRVTGNLPFNVATPLLLDLVRHGDRVERMGFLLQKEVADRLTAPPGTRNWGALGAWVQAWMEVTALADVQPGSFRPPPKVAGAFVGLRPRAQLPLPRESMPTLQLLIRAAFGQRRKTVRNALGSRLGRDEAVALLERAGIDPGARAEQLTLEHFVALAEAASIPASPVSGC